MIRIGVLGAAKIAPKAIIWPAQARLDCRILAVASRDLGRAQRFAKEHDIEITLDDYKALVSHPDVDLVYNALPPHRHADLTIAALKAGKSVLCEKPFALNKHEADAMVSTAELSDGYLIEAFHYCFHPAVLKFLHIIHSGQIGKILDMEGVFNVSIPNKPGELRYLPKLGGGAMMDLGCYVLHLSRLVSRAEPIIGEVSALMSDSGVDVALEARLSFAGIKSHIQCDMREGTERKISFKVTGDAGNITFDQFVHPYRQFSIRLETQRETSTFSHKDKDADYTRSTYDYQLDHVIDVLRGNASPLTGGMDAINTMQAIDKIYEAAGLER